MNLLTTALVYFHEVSRTGSISEAALAQHVSPSAISRQISQLEAAVGTKLFERQPRGMSLTDAGLLLLSFTRRAESEGAALIERLATFQSLSSTVIKIVSSEGLARYKVPAAIAAVCAKFDGVSFKLDVMPSEEATRRVVDGDVDVGVVFTSGLDRGVLVEHSVPMPVYAAVSVDHPLADKQTITLAELCQCKLALPDRGVSQRDLFDLAVQVEQLNPEIVLICDQVNPILEFARSGVGATLVSRAVVPRGSDEGLALITIDHPAFQRREGQIQTMPGRTQSPLLTVFISEMTAHLAG
ncbi:LysR family transcriptional regulator (plasmid) [Rhodococcus pseudokoreensis]|uniref:LysR family transcriptional regulator n=1 Tax=Rhodococcus pseudokoreensis TaxID=2811421 RepID=A0A974VXC0_9NOCA|nr:LysR family transcriptional regulator [Rhodococcus pseudokoreensis]QSE87344.1 LysR family transcriptional regulator [Rhodococcus pseudokoreensis]